MRSLKDMHGCALPAVYHGVCNPNKPPSGSCRWHPLPYTADSMPFCSKYVHTVQVQTLVPMLNPVVTGCMSFISPLPWVLAKESSKF